MANGDSEKELQDFLRRHGYYIPETEEEAQSLRHALDFVMEAVTAKRKVRNTARTALVWGIVATLAIAATKETVSSLVEAVKRVFE